MRITKEDILSNKYRTQYQTVEPADDPPSGLSILISIYFSFLIFAIVMCLFDHEENSFLIALAGVGFVVYLCPLLLIDFIAKLGTKHERKKTNVLPSSNTPHFQHSDMTKSVSTQAYDGLPQPKRSIASSPLFVVPDIKITKWNLLGGILCLLSGRKYWLMLATESHQTTMQQFLTLAIVIAILIIIFLTTVAFFLHPLLGACLMILWLMVGMFFYRKYQSRKEKKIYTADDILNGRHLK